MTIDQLILHPKAKTYLVALQAETPHALLLTGSEGVGLATIARSLTGRKQLVAFIQPLDKQDAPDPNGSINIKTIRELYTQTRSKHTGDQFIIVDDADRMSHGAQSAFLKLLEEPVEAIHFILTSHYPEKLLSTIRSRVQHIDIPAPPPQAIESMLATVDDATTKAQLTFVARGKPALLHRLMTDATAFEHMKSAMNNAKQFITGTPYQRFCLCYTYGKTAAEARRFAETLITVVSASLASQPRPEHIRLLDSLARCIDNVDRGYNPRLQLLGIVL